MSLVGALGCGLQLVVDPDAKIGRQVGTPDGRSFAEQRPHLEGHRQEGRASGASELARKGGRSRWAGKSPEERQAHVAMMNRRRLASKSKAA